VSRLELDHVLIAVPDLESAAADAERRFGVASVEGGRHPGWGTANRIVPLGTSYLELIAVVDPAEAAASPLGTWVSAASGGDPQLLGWAVRPADLDAVTARHGLTIAPGSRQAPGGELLSWRSAGLERAIAEPCLPFFIEWSAGTRFPGLAADPRGIAIRELGLTGDEQRLADWLGSHELPIVVRPGPPAVERLELAGRTTRWF
jgi:hypothetical protein